MSNLRINTAALTRLMKERGFDAPAVAEMTTLDNESVNRIIESGITGIDTAVEIAVTLNVGLYELLMPPECGAKLYKRIGGLTMGQHKTNPVAIAAKEGRLPPKEKNRMSKRQAERLLMLEMERRLIPAPLREQFRIYREIWERGM